MFVSHNCVSSYLSYAEIKTIFWRYDMGWPIHADKSLPVMHTYRLQHLQFRFHSRYHDFISLVGLVQIESWTVQKKVWNALTRQPSSQVYAFSFEIWWNVVIHRHLNTTSSPDDWLLRYFKTKLIASVPDEQLHSNCTMWERYRPWNIVPRSSHIISGRGLPY